MISIFVLLALFFCCCPGLNAQTAEVPGAVVAEQSQATVDRVDRTTLSGKVMCGYQGWFNCQGDGSGLGWTHWARDRSKPFGPGNVTVDLWPDVSELGASERYATAFLRADGRPAEVFSSGDRETVLCHFRWMHDYWIDGVFLQRFANGLSRSRTLEHKNRVLSHVRKGADRWGRTFAIMYDLSGLRAGQVSRVRDDWAKLRADRIDKDPAYLHHEGKPVVAVWGVGFSDGRDYTLAECRELVRWLKSQDCSVMLGTPSYWRDGDRDAMDDPILKEILREADVISPWTVGRYRTPQQATRHAENVWRSDRDWCERHQIDFMPVVFPGFSWHNLKGEAIGAIDRLKGQFMWSQIVGARKIGCDMIYVAMFDEVDEGTAIFKCTNQPPTGNGGEFLTFDGLPSDFYLKLVGYAGKLLRNEIDIDSGLPDGS